MSVDERTYETLVLGTRLFIDLWSVKGFVPVNCEHPEDVRTVWSRLVEDRVAFILVEEGWFDRLPHPVKQRIHHMGRPVWVPFPDMKLRED